MLRIALVFLTGFATVTLGGPRDENRELPLSTLHDKIAGGWAGQMVGVSYGWPTEFKYKSVINEDPLSWTPDRVSNALEQDDLYVDMTFSKVLDEKGLDATTEDFGAALKDTRYKLWSASLTARRLLQRGVPATLTGTPKYNVHANCIDFQIMADFIGLMAPALPQAANEVAWRAGRVMNYGDGIYGGMFVAGMYAAAFFENDPRRVVEQGLASIPPSSPYARLIRDVLDWSRQHPQDWKKVWRMIEDKWNCREVCSAHALRPTNIDARLNGAYIVLGLLFGNRDFGKTIEISTRAGQDSDCNPASSGGILGVMLGYEGIPDEWKGGIPALGERKFQYTDFSFRTIVESTEKRALELVRRNGGRVEAGKLVIKTQAPKAPALEIWDDYGSAVERIAASDVRWKFDGAWRQDPKRPLRTASEKGAQAEITFTGSGAIITGVVMPTGGKYDVYLDGKLDATLDVYNPDAILKPFEAVWHKFGLANEAHTVKLVVRGEPYPGSKGSDVAINDMVLFR